MTQEFDELQEAIRRYGKQYRMRIVAAAVVLAVFWASGSMFYKVEANSEGVLLRLGKFSKRTSPGLHFKLPWPLERVYTVPVEKVQSLEFGYRSAGTSGRRTQYAPPRKEDKSMARMLTADLNLAHVEWVVQYRIKNPEHYLFKIGGGRRGNPVSNAHDLIRDVSEAVMRRITGDASVDSVITIGREQIAADAKEEMQQLLDGFESGIRIVAVKLQSATPPDPVKDAFDAVNRAKQSKERVVNEAKGERNRLIPAARGKRDRAIAEAEGYALRVKMEATGRANAFISRLTEYNKAPEITKTRLYLEAMEQVLMQVEDKTVIDESIKGILPLLDLGAGATTLPRTGSATRGQKGGGR